mmetsp:Transcript_38431/g.91160  ORF Transcript_38431/g.91160 Transcript_38431/m.91160 type:complete len:500 (+) Transcript_38431:1763-3262(+)
MGSSLDQRQAKGLLPSNVGEHAPRGIREVVDVRDVRLPVSLGVRDRSVEVVLVDQLQHGCQDVGAALRHRVDIVTVPHDEHEVAYLPKHRALPKRLDEGHDVLLRIWAAHGQDRRLVRVVEEAEDVRPERRLRPLRHRLSLVLRLAVRHDRRLPRPAAARLGRCAAVRVTSPVRRLAHRLDAVGHPLVVAEVESGRDDRHHGDGAGGVPLEPQRLLELGVVAVVERPLLLDLLLGAGEDHQGGVERSLLSLDAAVDHVGAVDLCPRHRSRLEEVVELVAPERVSREHHVGAEHRGDDRRRVPRVGVVPVDCVEAAVPLLPEGHERRPAVGNGAVGELPQVRPQRLLVEVPPAGPKREPNDEGSPELAASGRDALYGLCVAPVHLGVVDQPRDEVDAVDGVDLREGARELDDVLDLPSGVGVAAELHALPADEAVDRQQHDVEPVEALAEVLVKLAQRQLRQGVVLEVHKRRRRVVALPMGLFVEHARLVGGLPAIRRGC